jgi:hypothetical protein
LKCEKLMDDRRRTPSDGKSSHSLWQGELKIPHCRNSSKIYHTVGAVPKSRKAKKYHTVRTVPKSRKTKKIPHFRNSSKI